LAPWLTATIWFNSLYLPLLAVVHCLEWDIAA